MAPTVSPVFNIPIKAYAAARARQYALKAGVALAIPLIAAIIAGFYDIRWWFVGLMGIFIVYPMVLTFAWFALTGSPALALLLHPQRWIFNNDKSVDIEFFRFDLENNPEATETRRIEIDDITPGSRLCTLKAASGQQFDFLLIPAELLPTDFLNQFSE